MLISLLEFIMELLSRNSKKKEPALPAAPEPVPAPAPAAAPVPEPAPVPPPAPPAPAPTQNITRAEVLKGREKEFPLTPELETNLASLLVAVNKFRDKYGKPMYINSGYRPGYYNTWAGGAPHSAHITCQAADFNDVDRSITNFILSRPSILEECGLWMEDPKSTVSWVHLQVRPLLGGTSRIFLP